MSEIGFTLALSTPGQMGVLLMAIDAYTIFIITAHLMSDFWQTSCRFVWLLRHDRLHHHDVTTNSDANSAKYGQRISKGLAPLRFNVAGLYTMEKSAKLTMAGVLVFGTGKMLLIFT